MNPQFIYYYQMMPMVMLSREAPINHPQIYEPMVQNIAVTNSSFQLPQENQIKEICPQNQEIAHEFEQSGIHSNLSGNHFTGGIPIQPQVIQTSLRAPQYPYDVSYSVNPGQMYNPFNGINYYYHSQHQCNPAAAPLQYNNNQQNSPQDSIGSSLSIKIKHQTCLKQEFENTISSSTSSSSCSREAQKIKASLPEGSFKLNEEQNSNLLQRERETPRYGDQTIKQDSHEREIYQENYIYKETSKISYKKDEYLRRESAAYTQQCNEIQGDEDELLNCVKAEAKEDIKERNQYSNQLEHATALNSKENNQMKTKKGISNRNCLEITRTPNANKPYQNKQTYFTNDQQMKYNDNNDKNGRSMINQDNFQLNSAHREIKLKNEDCCGSENGQIQIQCKQEGDDQSNELRIVNQKYAKINQKNSKTILRSQEKTKNEQCEKKLISEQLMKQSVQPSTVHKQPPSCSAQFQYNAIQQSSQVIMERMKNSNADKEVNYNFQQNNLCLKSPTIKNQHSTNLVGQQREQDCQQLFQSRNDLFNQKSILSNMHKLTESQYFTQYDSEPTVLKQKALNVVGVDKSIQNRQSEKKNEINITIQTGCNLLTQKSLHSQQEQAQQKKIKQDSQQYTRWENDVFEQRHKSRSLQETQIPSENSQNIDGKREEDNSHTYKDCPQVVKQQEDSNDNENELSIENDFCEEFDYANNKSEKTILKVPITHEMMINEDENEGNTQKESNKSISGQNDCENESQLRKVAVGNASKNILKAFQRYVQSLFSRQEKQGNPILTSLNRMFQRNTMSNLFLIKLYLNKRYNKLMRDFIENFALNWLLQSKVQDYDLHLQILNQLQNDHLSILKTKKKRYQRKKIIRFNAVTNNKKKPNQGK